MPRVNYFEMQALDPERAAEFYTRVFGWDIKKWDGPADYWLINTGEGEGIDGGMAKGQTGAGTILSIDVDSVDDYTKKITGAGGNVIKPKQALPGSGWLALCEDTEGNTFYIMENDPDAG
ncbi:VOC family protein [candidate division WOR-3 bacterium]|uniref:VOC family protein n=1 Tax=candidate division WOR-3 bacterium TaxID=2052148 RepID=A0A9D5QBX0_UNCW3|nr:VOC family protein [candidate division WOR-3 bacterium]MBD3364048.1 VOC family protein [candidate division WOR-3 bacterium]